MTGARYGGVAIGLHWLVAALVLGQLALGWWMLDLPKSPPGLRAGWFNFHKSIGLTIGLLMLARLWWRARHPAPTLPASVPRWQILAAKANHAGLYACLLLMPLSGYLGSVFSGGNSDPSPANTVQDWTDMYDRLQKQALKSRLKIPILFGVDAVHGHSNVVGATIFPHNLALGATRNAKLVEEVHRLTALGGRTRRHIRVRWSGLDVRATLG